jgi:cation/acetate symporter
MPLIGVIDSERAAILTQSLLQAIEQHRARTVLIDVTGVPLVDIAKAMALPNAMETWPTLAHPMANKVGWFDLNNIACGLLGMPFGFLVIYVVSLMGKEPSKEMQAYVDEIRKPRGRTVIEENI